MKINQIVFCVILIALALVFGVLLSGSFQTGLMAIGAMAFLGVVLGLVALLRPFSSGVSKQPTSDINAAIRAASERQSEKVKEATT